MKVYLVGGAVRDTLLNVPVHERDWVVVGSTPDALLKQGYQQVGRDFPVFLHPITKEEYALARTERKVGAGYYGFLCDANPHVTLEEDLLRRDLTINAMALDEAGHLIDPYDGAADLKNKILRHVSLAFVEDPVRVLRLARFAARFYPLGFRVADETAALVKQMVLDGALNHLVPERVWQEWEKSFAFQNPEKFILVLDALGALEAIFPMLPRKQLKIMIAQLVAVSGRTENTKMRFAAFMLGIADELVVDAFCRWLRVPNTYRDLARYAVRLSGIHFERADDIVYGLEKVDAFRNPKRFHEILTVCESRTDIQAKWFSALEACQNVAIAELVKAGYQGEAMKEALHQARVAAVIRLLS